MSATPERHHYPHVHPLPTRWQDNDGLRAVRVAGSSVEYQLALFKVGEAQPCAAGRMVQVFVERATGQPASLPTALQGALVALQG
ncbi:hypothetical protein [Pseudomonas palmensis]|uniref:hypothetical protein n=1 Tax=Pseudomonas palmensis TaxID=2815362 RepID=UPI003CE6BDB2